MVFIHRFHMMGKVIIVCFFISIVYNGKKKKAETERILVWKVTSKRKREITS